MAAWIGPAIIAAVISSMVSALGWYVNYRTTVELDRHRRKEKVRDFQIALRAEIRSELYDLGSHDLESQLTLVRERYASIPGYSVLVPSPTRHVIYEAVTSELYFLPEDVIDPIVLYNRQRDSIDKLVSNMRGSDFRDRNQEQQLEMYEDYLRLRTYLGELAGAAMIALDDALNNRGGVPSVPKSVSDNSVGSV